MEIVSSDDQEFQIQEGCSTTHLTFKTPTARNPLIRQRSGTFAGFTEIEGNRTAGSTVRPEIKEEELQEKEKIKKLLNERRKFSRQNKWGNCSYKDLIVAAIESSPSKKMTLNEIYEWIVKNIQYFKNDSDTNSSVAWKNSVRHNLSLHPIFQKEPPQTGGSRSIGSYWKIDRSKDRAKGRGRAKTLPMQDLQSARVRRTDKPPTGRKSKSKVTKTGQQRRDSTPYNDSSIKKSSHVAMIDDNPMSELNNEFFKMGHPSTVASCPTPSAQPPIPVLDDGDEQVTIQQSRKSATKKSNQSNEKPGKMQEARIHAELDDDNTDFFDINAGDIKDYLSQEKESKPLVINCYPRNPPARPYLKTETVCKKASKTNEPSKKGTSKKASKSKTKKCKKQPSKKEIVKEEDPDFAPPYLPPNYVNFYNNYMSSKALEDSEFWEVKKKRPQTQPTVFKYPNPTLASNIHRPSYQMSIPSTSSSCFSAAQNRRPVQQPSTSQDLIFRCPPLPMRLHSQSSVSHQLHHQPSRQHSVALRPSQQASTSLQIHYEDPSEQQQTAQIEEMETYELQPIENHANISSNDQETHLLTMMEVKTDEHQNSNQQQQTYMSQQTVSSPPMAQHQQSVNAVTFPELPFQCQLQASQQIQLPELQRREIIQQHLNFPQPLLQQQNHHHQLMQMAPMQSHQSQQINPQTSQTVNKDDPDYWPENITWDELV